MDKNVDGRQETRCSSVVAAVDKDESTVGWLPLFCSANGRMCKAASLLFSMLIVIVFRLKQSDSFLLLFTPANKDNTVTLTTKIRMVEMSSSTFHNNPVSSSDFPYVHSSIATVLSLACQQHQSPYCSSTKNAKAVLDDDYTIRLLVPVQDNHNQQVVEESTANASTTSHGNENQAYVTTTTFDQTNLVALALLCDDAVFAQNSTFTTSCPSRRTLVQLGSVSTGSTGTKSVSAEITAATLLALNALESAIRGQHLQHSTGGAPLLKTMLQQLDNNHLIPILEALLLPTGLNLRNLLWHGFCGASSVLRPWLALVLVLIENITESTQHGGGGTSCSNNNNNNNSPILPSSITRQDENGTDNFWDWQQHLSEVIQRGEELRQQIIQSDMTPSCSSASSLRHMVQKWLPPSHYELWNLTLKCMFCVHNDDDDDENGQCCSFGACSASLMVILLEHGLRLDWCRLNDNHDRQLLQDQTIARPNTYYVTLDGHGQRRQHDLLLHPYRTAASFSLDGGGCQDDDETKMKKKNALVEHLGGSATALLSDLFCSPNGPNLRAALAHGLWDDFIKHELTLMYDNNDACKDIGYNSDAIRNCNLILLVAMEQAAVATLSNNASTRLSTFAYYPRFSLTATTISSIQAARGILQKLHDILQDESTVLALTSSVSSMGPTTAMTQLHIPLALLESHFQLALKALSLSDRDPTEQLDGHEDLASWKSSNSVYTEHETNKQLAPLGASRALLNDIEEALNCYFVELQRAREKLIANVQLSVEQQQQQAGKPLLTSRQQKRLQRIIACGYVLDVFCSFSLLVAMFSLEDGLGILPAEMQVLQSSDMLRAVERTRMTVSTVKTFLTTNAERAFKSIEEYIKGKEVKKIINNVIETRKV